MPTRETTYQDHGRFVRRDLRRHVGKALRFPNNRQSDNTVRSQRLYEVAQRRVVGSYEADSGSFGERIFNQVPKPRIALWRSRLLLQLQNDIIVRVDEDLDETILIERSARHAQEGDVDQV